MKIAVGKILSVSVAAYNVEKYIREALEPFCQENVIGRVEVLVIDDGGSDATLSIAKEYSDKYPDSIKLVHKKNGGWGSTLNTGFDLAEGKYFKQLDGDDYFRSDTLADFLDQLEKSQADVVSTPFEVFDDETGEVTGIRGTYPITNKDLGISDAHKFMKFEMHNCAVKTSILKSSGIRITEHCFYTDNEFIFKIVPFVKTVKILDIPVYRYRLGRTGQSVSLAGLKKHYHDFERVMEEMIACYNIEADEENRKILQAYLVNMMNSQYMIYQKLGMLRAIREYDRKIKICLPEVYNRARKRVKAWRKIYFVSIPLECCVTRMHHFMLSKGFVKTRKAFS